MILAFLSSCWGQFCGMPGRICRYYIVGGSCCSCAATGVESTGWRGTRLEIREGIGPFMVDGFMASDVAIPVAGRGAVLGGGLRVVSAGTGTSTWAGEIHPPAGLSGARQLLDDMPMRKPASHFLGTSNVADGDCVQASKEIEEMYLSSALVSEVQQTMENLATRAPTLLSKVQEGLGMALERSSGSLKTVYSHGRSEEGIGCSRDTSIGLIRHAPQVFDGLPNRNEGGYKGNGPVPSGPLIVCQFSTAGDRKSTVQVVFMARMLGKWGGMSGVRRARCGGLCRRILMLLYLNHFVMG